MAGASDIELDLHLAIDRLLFLKADLQGQCGIVRDPHDARREQLSFVIRQVSERAIAIEDVVMRVGASVVVVTAKRGVAESLRCAMHRLDRLDSSDDAESFDELMSRAIDALHAADAIGVHAAGGRPDAAVRHDVRVERVARSDEARHGVVVARIGPPSPLRVVDARPARSVGR